MRITLLMSLVIACFLTSSAHAVLYPGIAPANVTAGEKFLVFAKILDSTGKIITDPASVVSAKYSSITKSLAPLNTLQPILPGSSDYWAIDVPFYASSAKSINLTASYVDTQLGTVVESIIANISVGSLTIVFTGSTDFNMTKKIGENISFVAYLKDASKVPYIPPVAKISYFVYDSKKMEVFEGLKPFVQCTVDETKLCASHTITAEHPVGIISFYASNGTDVGGKNVLFAASPYELYPGFNATYIIPGESLKFSLNLNNIYGELSGIETNITFPDGTVFPVYLSNENGYSTSFTAPNMSGNYIFNATVNHTIKGITKHSSVFEMHAADLTVQTNKSVYAPGETVDVTISAYDFDGTSLKLTANATVTNPSGDNKYYSNTKIASFGNIRSFSYELAPDATEGYYSVSVNAEDLFGRKYFYTTYFYMNAGEKTLFATPSSITTSFDATGDQTYTITLSSNSTSTIDSIYVSLSNEISDYAIIDAYDMLSSLEPYESTSFYVMIMPNEFATEPVYSGNVLVSFDDNVLTIPITIENIIPASSSFDVVPSVSKELLSGMAQNIMIEIENTGTETITGLDADFSSEIYSYVSNSDLRSSIEVGAMEILSFDINIDDTGTYSGIITLSEDGGAEATVALSIEVFEDFSSTITALDGLRKTLNTRIIALEANGHDMTQLSEEIVGLQEGISEVNSFYEYGMYSEAKSMIYSLQQNANDIQSALDSMEEVPPETDPPEDDTTNNGICEGNELCSSVDCIGDERCTTSDDDGGSGLTIIIVVLAVTILLIVLATSIMPGEKRKEPVPI